MTLYRVARLQPLDDWLATDPAEDVRLIVLTWLHGLVEDPRQRPSVRIPRTSFEEARAAVIPGTNVGVVYLVLEHTRVVLLERVNPGPPNGLRFDV
jgi:hypothetical protein